MISPGHRSLNRGCSPARPARAGPCGGRRTCRVRLARGLPLGGFEGGGLKEGPLESAEGKPRDNLTRASSVTVAGPGRLRGTRSRFVAHPGRPVGGAAPGRGRRLRRGLRRGVAPPTGRPGRASNHDRRSHSSSMLRRRRPRASAPSSEADRFPGRESRVRQYDLERQGAEARGRRRQPMRGPAGPRRSL